MLKGKEKKDRIIFLYYVRWQEELIERYCFICSFDSSRTKTFETMYRLLINLVNIWNIQCLICPIYNLFNNETNSSQFTFIQSERKIHRCLGIYFFDRQTIRIRQLAFVDDYENRYENQTDCFLDIDRMGTNLLCRCNSDNCTLNWKMNSFVQQKFTTENQQQIHFNKNQFWWLFSLLFIVLLLLFIIYVIYRLNSRRTSEKENTFYENISSTSTNISHAEIDEFLSSNPTYQSIIHRSQTNTIYRALTTYQQEKKLVAIKLYLGQTYKTLFENELQILQLIHHSSIINFLSHGWHDLSPYIILEYAQYGSLEMYLRSTKISWSTCYSFLNSFLNAIDYLHYEELSTNDYLTSNRIRKPIIIHRDIKSSNILIKSNLNLCLADFGLAKILPTILSANDFIQIGTYRYMSPELLELAITHTSDALCKVDMYAVGLVMWEIVTQCQEYPCSMDYKLPYEEYLNRNETNENRILDILHRNVVQEHKRPILHRTENMNTKISDLFTLIDDCWKHEPDARLNARPALYRLRRLE